MAATVAIVSGEIHGNVLQLLPIECDGAGVALAVAPVPAGDVKALQGQVRGRGDHHGSVPAAADSAAAGRLRAAHNDVVAGEQEWFRRRMRACEFDRAARGDGGCG